MEKRLSSRYEDQALKNKYYYCAEITVEEKKQNKNSNKNILSTLVFVTRVFRFVPTKKI